MALRRAYRASRASRPEGTEAKASRPSEETGRSNRSPARDTDAEAAPRRFTAPSSDGPSSRPPVAGPSHPLSPADLARLACELIPLCTSSIHSPAFRDELLIHLREAQPEAQDRALALALIQIRLQLIAYAPPRSTPCETPPEEAAGR